MEIIIMDKRQNSDLAKRLQLLHQAGGDGEQAAMMVKNHAPWLVKAGVGSTALDDLAGDFSGVAAGELMRILEHGPSAFDRVRPFSRQAEFRTRLLIGSAPLTGSVVAEGAAVLMSKYVLDASGLTPIKVAALAATTAEAMASPAGAADLEGELGEAVAQATDQAFCGILADGAAESETATGDPVADLGKLIGHVNTTGFGRLFFLIGPSVASVLCSWRETDGDNLVFPDMGPLGGSLLGVEAIVTAGLDDSIILLDARGLFTGSDDVRIKYTSEASLLMDDNPGVGTPELVGMFQSESVGVLAIRSFAADLKRASAAAVLETITWGA
ncbi:hypothetical protein [Desulfurivibrio sp. C05AmB]|uniref:hypothetical protein n=1 Tax=Desulfurivibrio sp. C05AmB TaxID=3374371 RepID=UPI00376F3727